MMHIAISIMSDFALFSLFFGAIATRNYRKSMRSFSQLFIVTITSSTTTHNQYQSGCVRVVKTALSLSATLYRLTWGSSDGMRPENVIVAHSRSYGFRTKREREGEGIQN